MLNSFLFKFLLFHVSLGFSTTDRANGKQGQQLAMAHNELCALKKEKQLQFLTQFGDEHNLKFIQKMYLI